MNKAEWAKAKEQLQRPWPYGRVTLEADGYEVTLQLHPIDLMDNGIFVLVNGQFKGKWLMEDCEERRRFLPQREKPVASRKTIAAWNKLTKRQKKQLEELGAAPNRTYIEYSTHWTSWSALVKHFEAHNADIRIKEATEC